MKMDSFDEYLRETGSIVEAVRPDPSLGSDHPRDYKPSQGLVDAVNTALVLNRPLLLTGDPGTGKTQLAYSLAWQLANRGKGKVTDAQVIKFETKSTTVARDLFYSFDKVAHFHAADGKKEAVHYIAYQALGAALLRALPAEQVSGLYPPGHVQGAPSRSVVLIDEIDKASRDFPNDLLNELDQMYFRVAELDNVKVGGTGQIDDSMKPIVIITSNSDKVLPPPFLRRCIYYEIPFPDPADLAQILSRRLGAADAVFPLVKDAVDFLVELKRSAGSSYNISAPEVGQWVRAMKAAGADLSQPLSAASKQAVATFSAMVKFRDPDRKCLALLNEFIAR
jgi:MoxR-like ATPase